MWLAFQLVVYWICPTPPPFCSLKKITKGLDLDDVSSSEDEMVAPAPPVKHVVQQHTVTKEHKAEIYKTAMLTEQTLKEILESKIPQPPQLPSQNYLLGKIKKY